MSEIGLRGIRRSKINLPKITLCGEVFLLCWQGKQLVFKLGKAGIGRLCFVLLHGRGHRLRLCIGSRGCHKFRRMGRNILRHGGAGIVRCRAIVKKLFGLFRFLAQFGFLPEFWLVGLPILLAAVGKGIWHCLSSRGLSFIRVHANGNGLARAC